MKVFHNAPVRRTGAREASGLALPLRKTERGTGRFRHFTHFRQVRRDIVKQSIRLPVPQAKWRGSILRLCNPPVKASATSTPAIVID